VVAFGALIAGCGGNDSDPSSSAHEDPSPLGDKPVEHADSAMAETSEKLDDVVFSMAAHIAGGEETTKCLLVAMPSERGEIAVPSAESSYTVGSHHFLVFRTDMTKIPEGGDSVYDCSDGDIDAHTTGSCYEAQSPESRRDYRWASRMSSSPVRS
jgi:hypothetical protein